MASFDLRDIANSSDLPTMVNQEEMDVQLHKEMKKARMRGYERKHVCLGVSVLISGSLWMSLLGCQFMYSQISGYIESYFQIDQKDTWLIRPISITAAMPFTVIGSHLAQNHMNARLQLFIAGVIMIGGMIAATFTKNFALFVILYPGLSGVASGLTYVVPMNMGWQYFPGREGLITGLIDTSYGLGAALFGTVLNSLINPTHEPINPDGDFPFDDSIAGNLPGALRTLAYIWAG